MPGPLIKLVKGLMVVVADLTAPKPHSLKPGVVKKGSDVAESGADILSLNLL